MFLNLLLDKTMSNFSYLDYLDDFGPDSRIKLFEASNLSIEEISNITGYSVGTMKRWFDQAHPKFNKGPSIYSWNLGIYKLEANLKGFPTLTDLINSV